MFHPWAGLLSEFELGLIHLPGRDKRVKEALSTELIPLVEELSDALIPHLDRPFAFFGHSMGALLGFEVARYLRNSQALQPIHLFLSARHPAHRVDPYADIYKLPENEFIISTERLYGSLPEVVKQDQEILKLFLSIMRADFTMLGTYRYSAGPPLDSPISVFGGLQDPSVTESELRGWREQTTAPFNLTMFAGDHFFIQSSRAALLEQIRKISSSFVQ